MFFSFSLFYIPYICILGINSFGQSLALKFRAVPGDGPGHCQIAGCPDVVATRRTT